MVQINQVFDLSQTGQHLIFLVSDDDSLGLAKIQPHPAARVVQNDFVGCWLNVHPYGCQAIG
jgi:hypothetical protein